MRVEISTEAYPRKQPETNADEPYSEPEVVWQVSETIDSAVDAVVAAFLCGVANELDPPGTPSPRSQVVTNNPRMRIRIWEFPNGKSETLLTDLVSRRHGTIAATLRGAAKTLEPKRPGTRGE